MPKSFFWRLTPTRRSRYSQIPELERPDISPKPNVISLPKKKPWHKENQYIVQSKHDKGYRVVNQGQDILNEGFGGYKNWSGATEGTKMNEVFGKDSIWASKTIDGATNFFYEKLKPTFKRQNLSVYEIDLRGLPVVDIEKQNPEALSRIMDQKSPKHHRELVKWVDTYVNEVVPHNKEIVIKGGIEGSRIKKIRDIDIPTQERHDTLRGREQVKRVQIAMNKVREQRKNVKDSLIE